MGSDYATSARKLPAAHAESVRAPRPTAPRARGWRVLRLIGRGYGMATLIAFVPGLLVGIGQGGTTLDAILAGLLVALCWPVLLVAQILHHL